MQVSSLRDAHSASRRDPLLEQSKLNEYDVTTQQELCPLLGNGRRYSLSALFKRLTTALKIKSNNNNKKNKQPKKKKKTKNKTLH